MPSPEPWRHPERTPALAGDEVHLWRAWLDMDPDQLARLAERRVVHNLKRRRELE
jgi:hypothetical protein